MGKIAKALDKARKESISTEDQSRPWPAAKKSADPLHVRSEDDRDVKSASPDITASLTDAYSEERTGPMSTDLQGPVSPMLVVFHEPDSLAAEHFKELRAQILYPKDGKPRRVILVTSAMDQEGKTMVACNLAVSIAQGVDPYALLIDGDIRNPSVHSMLGLEQAEGLSEYLQGDKPLSGFLIRVPMMKLTILPGGHSVRNPSELISSTKMIHLLEEARERYSDRYIIVDSPPVNLAAETSSLSQYVDTVIFVVRYGYSNQDLVEEAMARLEKDKVLGIVFNAFEKPSRKYAYYNKKYPDHSPEEKGRP